MLVRAVDSEPQVREDAPREWWPPLSEDTEPRWRLTRDEREKVERMLVILRHMRRKVDGM